tara:strand:+ start:914 stop:1585 length:672 start_codon:yes stop_codon:yes gene_type:complete
MTKIIHDIINKNFNGAEKLVRENLENIAERKIIEMKKMIAAKNIMEEEANIFEFDTSNMRRSDNVEDRRDEVLKTPSDQIGDLIKTTEKNYNSKSKNTPEETPNDRVKGGFDAMNNPNKVNRDTKGDQLKAKNANMEEETLDEARFKIVRARIRNGVVQRRKKVSTAPGLTFRGGKLTRMSPAERRHRKMGQRRGKLKRRAKMSRTLRKRTMSLRKRSRLGIK